MKPAFVLWAAALALSAPAVSAAKTEPIVMSHVLWKRAPSPAQVAEAFAGATGGAPIMLTCKLQLDGGLRACAADPDAGPPGAVQAALRLADRFRVDVDALTTEDFSPFRVRLAVRPPADGPGVLDDPDWVRTLPADMMQAVFPAKAADSGLDTGRAVLDCVAAADGTMTGCQVLSEDPADMDFGPAALRVASAMGVNLWTQDGRPVQGAHVKFAIRLNRQEPATPAS